MPSVTTIATILLTTALRRRIADTAGITPRLQPAQTADTGDQCPEYKRFNKSADNIVQDARQAEYAEYT